MEKGHQKGGIPAVKISSPPGVLQIVYYPPALFCARLGSMMLIGGATMWYKCATYGMERIRCSFAKFIP